MTTPATKPRHFKNLNFDAFILECAIRDRKTFLEAIVSDYEPQPFKEEIVKTLEEIKFMEKKLALLYSDV